MPLRLATFGGLHTQASGARGARYPS